MTTLDDEGRTLFDVAGRDEPSIVPDVITTEDQPTPQPVPPGRFSGRRALVTGGGSGIGLAVVRRLLSEGAQVLAADLDPGPAGSEGAETVRCDVTDPAQVEAAATIAEPVDLVVAVAGLAPPPGALWEAEPDDLDRTLAVNVRGAFLTLRATLPPMRERGRGAVVLTASAAGLHGVRRYASYAASQHAIVGLARSAALDTADRGIRVNAVCPAVLPVDGYGDPDGVAALVAFLLSDEAGSINGAAVPADSGLSRP